jgi:hypothetical protein
MPGRLPSLSVYDEKVKNPKAHVRNQTATIFGAAQIELI